MERHSGIVHALRLAKLVEEATLRERLVSLGCRSAIERVAHLFCELLVRHQAAGLAKQNSFPLPITQADMADALGLSNVHVNRVLQDLRKQRLVELRRKALTILNLPRLKALAEFRADYLHAMAAEKERPVPEKASRPRDALTAYP